MTTQTMNENELITLAKNIHLNINKAEAEEFIALMMPGINTYHLISELEDEIPGVSYQRESGHEPAVEDNPLNAWAWIANISGAETGSLQGRTVAIKDNIAVAGMPMVNGSMTLKGFVPRFDATVVSRLLEAGATIKGKATCEQFCLSGGSHTSQPNAVHNPNKWGYSAGGSSSGSAALVAAGQVDMAIGSDQGGSVRIPAAFCGAYGMKPTHGLVPYTGAMPIEATVDHLGPITSNVRDNALMLEVIAGYDGLDPRQFNPQTHTYTEALNKGVKGLKIGVLAEGFELSNLDVDVKNTVMKAIDIFEKLGAEITNVSIPEHALAAALWTPIGCEGLLTQMMLSNGMGHNWKGLYDSELTSKHSEWRQYSDELSPSLKLCMLLGEYGRTKYNGQLYGKAQNIARRAKKAYDDALENVDLLIMPTVPITAQPLPDENVSITESVARALEMIGNTSPQDVTGHPAMSIPCGVLDELPVGLMLVGKYYDECTIYQAASAFEQSTDWRTL